MRNILLKLMFRWPCDDKKVDYAKDIFDLITIINGPKWKKTGIVAYASNTSTAGEEAGGLWAWGHLGLYREPLSQIEKGRYREGETETGEKRDGGKGWTNKEIKERSMEWLELSLLNASGHFCWLGFLLPPTPSIIFNLLLFYLKNT